MARVGFTRTEEASLLHCAKQLAIATANYWGWLGKLERKYDIEIESMQTNLLKIAANCSSTPSLGDFKRVTFGDVFRTLRFVGPRAFR